jgi:hypothetical protein
MDGGCGVSPGGLRGAWGEPGTACACFWNHRLARAGAPNQVLSLGVRVNHAD